MNHIRPELKAMLDLFAIRLMTGCFMFPGTSPTKKAEEEIDICMRITAIQKNKHVKNENNLR